MNALERAMLEKVEAIASVWEDVAILVPGAYIDCNEVRDMDDAIEAALKLLKGETDDEA